MTPKIYASSAPPWENGGSSVERYQSGLVKVTQAYLCPTAMRDTLAAASFPVEAELLGIASPATDGLYIFPAPSTQDLNNGFAKITVTAYGRIKGGVSLSMQYRRVTIDLYGSNVDFYAPSYRMPWVMRSGELPIPDSIEAVKYKDPIYRVSVIDGVEKLSTYDVRRRTATYTTSPATNFGEMQEQVYNIEITPY